MSALRYHAFLGIRFRSEPAQWVIFAMEDVTSERTINKLLQISYSVRFAMGKWNCNHCISPGVFGRVSVVATPCGKLTHEGKRGGFGQALPWYSIFLVKTKTETLAPKRVYGKCNNWISEHLLLNSKPQYHDGFQIVILLRLVICNHKFKSQCDFE